VTTELRLNMRFIKFDSAYYLRAEDVFSLLEEFGGAEETDVRNRIGEIITNIKHGLPISQ
jgi:hypothetical protein